MPTAAQKKAAEAKAAKAAEAEAAKTDEAVAAETEAAAEEAVAEAEAAEPAVEAAARPEAAEGSSWYRNGTKFNIFTSKGRCMPNGTVELDDEEAKQCKGLELCQ